MLENNPIKVTANKIRSIRFKKDPCRRHYRLNGGKSTFIKTLKQYSERSSAHGINYIAEDGRPATERIFWVIVTFLALCFTAFQTITLYVQWKDDPVVTSLDTVALSIEEVDFPAVTICPQGAVREIGDAVLFKQFREYVMEKKAIEMKALGEGSRKKRSDINGDMEEMSYEKMMEETMMFLRDVYPRTDGKITTQKPIKMIQAMIAPEPQKAMESETLLGQSEEEECDVNDNAEFLDALNKQMKNNTCPEGFEILDDGSCIHKATTAKMNYEEAVEYCSALDGSKLLHFESIDSIEALSTFGIEIVCKYSIIIPKLVLLLFLKFIV